MKHLFSLSLLFFITLVHSQTPKNSIGTITGKIIDATLKEPLPYVNIIIKNSNNAILLGGITAEDGTFNVSKIPSGNHQVSIQFLGYKTINKPISISKNNKKINLGTIAIQEDATSLEEVTVVAETSSIQQKVDRKVINVGKDLVTAGATASEIMNNIPSVSVDEQSGNISLRGNENVRVMVDGKLSNIPAAQLLKQIPSSSIKSIELITNPSAKYNPEGMSGIINIKLHKNSKLGFNGNYSFNANHGLNTRYSNNLDMNYRNGKVNLFGNYGNNLNERENGGKITEFSRNFIQKFDNTNKGNSHLFKIGADYYINDKNTLSFFTNQNFYDGTSNSLTTLTNANKKIQQQPVITNSDNGSGQYNLVYKHNFKKEDETLDIELDYNDFYQDEIANFSYINFDFPPNFTDFVDTERDNTTINIDYVNPLNEKTKLETGGQVRLFNSNIKYASTGLSYDAIANIINTPSTDFSYNQDIYSLYATFSKTYNKFNFQLGARAELVDVDADALQFFNTTTETFKFTDDYFQLYPSAFFTYTPSEKNSFQLSFSRRVDRPSLNQVNPIRAWSTPQVSSLGNPELLPQFTNSVETNYTRQLKIGSVTAGIFYRMIEDEINRALFIDRNNVALGRSILSYNNFDDTSAYGIEVSTNIRPAKWWSINSSFDLFSQTQRGITEIIDVKQGQTPTTENIVQQQVTVDNMMWNVRLFNNLKASKSLTFTLFGMYRSKSDGIQFNRKPMYMVNTGARYTFTKERRATISFSYNDIFNTMRFAFDAETPFKRSGEFRWESNNWNLGLSYRFGGGKYRALQRKNRDSNEKSGNGGW